MMKRGASILLALLLACVLLFAACGGESPVEPYPGVENWPAEEGALVKGIGAGGTVFALEIVLQDGSKEYFSVLTDESTVGAALLALDGFKKADNGIINTVNGRTLDWNADQAYWAFEINGEYAMTGAEDTAIDTAAVYAFVYTKG